jgi:pimeloyl-ACP methyl ester carboxylesterase
VEDTVIAVGSFHPIRWVLLLALAMPVGLLFAYLFFQGAGNAVMSRNASRTLRWLIIGEASMLVVLALVGLIYESRSRVRDRREFPPPGRLVDVGGYRLHLQCAGEGATTAILDAGLVGSSLDWYGVLPDASRITRICAYDRGGYGWSERSTLPRTPDGIAEDLHVLLEKAGERPPYILVGHSLGGLNMWAFANRYTGEAAGLILVDSAHPQEQIVFPWRERARLLFLRAALPFGLPRWRGWCGGRDGEIRSVKAAITCQPRYQQSYYEQWAAMPAYMEAARKLTPLRDTPVILITRDPQRHGADKDGEEQWQQWQRDLSRISSNSRIVTAKGSDHDIPGHRPEQVVDAIREMLNGLPARANVNEIPRIIN